jgi:arabinose-5-phosphate isomerase
MHVGETVPSVTINTPMTDTLLAISQKGFGVVAVLDENQTLVGIVTDGDLRRHMDGLLDHTAGEVMTKSPATVSTRALAAEALAMMNDRKITCLFTAHPETPRKLAGVLHIHDCLRAGVV